MLKILSFLPGRFCTKNGLPLFVITKKTIKNKNKGEMNSNRINDMQKSKTLFIKILYTLF
ncbi:hypothetical protein GCM10007384_30340 [Aquimarina muelleri]|uniref:Uncharacterized protein n=1 Tax=Aquimarina muelleri TaxID=279356 RepID=A0A918JZQ5_9FLAO|nr:hypothetical protein GCM10007384_30340 [Aquimarina muelleri]